jgi:hypothetical protein
VSALDARSAAVVEEFSAIRKNSLRGFARVRLASGLILIDVAIHVSGDNKLWAAPPSKPMLDREGHVLRNVEGKICHAPMVAFATKEQRDRFSSLVVDAVRVTNPEGLA